MIGIESCHDLFCFIILTWIPKTCTLLYQSIKYIYIYMYWEQSVQNIKDQLDDIDFEDFFHLPKNRQLLRCLMFNITENKLSMLNSEGGGLGVERVKGV